MLGNFEVESLGIDHPDYFQGYGLGPNSPFSACCYGIGATESEALDDCLETMSQCMDFDDDTENRIRDEFGATYGDPDDTELAPEDSYFHVGIKWSSREEVRMERIRKLDVEPLTYDSYNYVDGVWGHSSRADGSVSYGDFKTATWDAENLYFYVPFASGSDYSGSTVERSNYLVFRESHTDEWVHDVYGGMGTYAVAVGVDGLLACDDDTFDMICEEIEKLADYPLLDEEALSQLEMDGAEEAWDSWVRGDFVRELEGKFAVDFEFPDGYPLRKFFEEMCERANEYWYCEGCGYDMYIQLSHVVAKIEFADVEKWAIRYEVVFNDPDENREDYFVESDATERVNALRASGVMGAFYNTIAPLIDSSEFGIVEGGAS